MNVFDATILGIVQGLTEFIPVSSSGHLILFREFIGVGLEGSLSFDAVLHLATALAILVYFRADIWKLITKPREHKVLWLALILGTIPAVVIGLFFGDVITAATRSVSVIVWTLIGGSILFVVAEWLSTQGSKLTGGKGFLIGIYQSFALIPGVSRAGASISGGLLFGLTRERATRFAFLLGFPILAGVGSLKLFELLRTGGVAGGEGFALFVGSLVAFFVGLGAIHWMLKFLRNHRLYVFAAYRVLLAILVFLFL